MEYKFEIKKLISEKSTGMVTSVDYYFGATHTVAYNGGFTYVTSERFNYVLTTGSSSDESFIQYNNLTEDIVLSWFTGSLNVSTLQNNASSSIATQEYSIVNEVSINEKPW